MKNGSKKTESDPMPIQIAFQGGGAKLVALMAAAEAIEELREDPEFNITVTRVAGTSAGSIAASMLASKKSIKNFKKDVVRHGPEALNGFKFPNLYITFWRAFRGKPILDEYILRRFINLLFKDAETNISDFDNQDVYILASNLDHSEKVIYGGERDAYLVDAIIDSCAIPFILRTHNDGTRIVDGGICANLPTNELFDKTQEKGRVIAVSFFHEPSYEKISNPVHYAQCLVETSMENSVKDAINRVEEGGGDVIQIDTSIATFQFEEALAAIDGDMYKRIKLETENQIKALLEKWRNEEADDIKIDTPSKPITHLEMSQRIYSLYECLHDPEHIKIKRSVKIVICNSLWDLDDQRHNSIDNIEHIIVLEPLEDGVRAFRSGLQVALPVEQKMEWYVYDGSGSKVEVICIPISKPSKLEGRESYTNHLIFFFKKQLDLDKSPYTISIKRVQKDAMDGILNFGMDWLRTQSTQSSLSEIQDNILIIPELLGDFEVLDLKKSWSWIPPELKPPGEDSIKMPWVDGRKLSPDELAEYDTYVRGGYRALGWRAENVAEGHACGGLFRKTQVGNGPGSSQDCD